MTLALAGVGACHVITGLALQAGCAGRAAHVDRPAEAASCWSRRTPSRPGRRVAAACVLGGRWLRGPGGLAARCPQAGTSGPALLRPAASRWRGRGAAWPARVVRHGADCAGPAGRPGRAVLGRGRGGVAAGSGSGLPLDPVSRPGCRAGVPPALTSRARPASRPSARDHRRRETCPDRPGRRVQGTAARQVSTDTQAASA